MNRNRMWILVTLGIALVFPVGCNRGFVGPGGGHHYGQQKSRVFEVYIYADPNNSSKCLLDWSVGTLWKSQQQTVTWFSDDGGEYTIDFRNGSHTPPNAPPPPTPFQNDTFTVPGNGSQSSGPLQPNASGYYDFQVRAGDTNGHICKDLKDDPGYYIR